MAKDVKGLNMAITADTTKVEKDLRELNKDLRTNASDANKLNKSLKMDPTAIDNASKALKNQQDVLSKNEQMAEDLKKQMDAIGEVDPNSEEWKKLERALLGVENNAQAARIEIDKLENIIESIESGDIEKAAKEIQKLGKYSQQATTEVDDLGQEFTDLSSILNSIGSGDVGSGKIVDSISAGGVAVSAAVGAASVAVAALTKEYEGNKAAAAEFTNDLNVTAEEAKDLQEPLSELVGILGTEYSTAADAATIAQNTFNKATMTSEEILAAYVGILMVLENGTISAEEAQTLLNTAMGTFNATNTEAVNLLIESAQMMEEYGAAADDVIDTFREWGDLAVTAGLSMQEFFTILTIGLESGAKSTDEVANAMNELFLSISEGSPETIAAFEAIGLSYADVVTMVNEGQLGLVFLMTAGAIAKMTEETERMTVAAELMGTAGEEWIATMDIEKVNEFSKSVGRLTLIQQRLSTITKELPAFMAEFGASMGLTEIEINKFNTALAQQGILAAFNTLTLDQQSIVLQTLAEQTELTSEQVFNLQMAQTTLGNESLTAAEKLASLKSILTEEQQALIENELATRGVTTSLDEMKIASDKLKGAYDMLSISVWDYSELSKEQQAMLDTLSEKTGIQITSYDDMKLALEKVNVDTSELTQNIRELIDPTTESADKMVILQDALTKMNKEGLISNEQFTDMSKKLDGVAKSIGKKDGMEDNMEDLNQSFDEINPAIADYLEKLEEQKTLTDELSESMSIYNQEWDDLISNISTYNSMPAPSLPETPDTGFFSIGGTNVTTEQVTALEPNQEENSSIKTGTTSNDNKKIFNIKELTINSQIKDFDKFIPDLFNKLDAYAERLI